MTRDIVPGAVAHFSDGQRTHSGVILSLSQDGRDTWALFLTTNPKWNRKSRVATSEEIAMCGFPQNKETFLAPVVRPTDDATAAGIDFPEHRLESLRKEFGPDPLAPLIFTLPDDIYPPVKLVRPKMPTRMLHELMMVEVKKKSVPVAHDKQALEDYLIGKAVFPRSELRRVVGAYPKLEAFFTRRASVTLSLQVIWERTGHILNEHLERQKIPRKLLAARMGLPERDVLAFETGLQCPSYQEMLTAAAFLPELPDEWSLPCSVPLLCDCVTMSFLRLGWTFQKASSTVRIPYDKLMQMLVFGARPTGDEIQRLRIVCPEVPPWRAYFEHLDGQVDLERMFKEARRGSRR